MKWRGVKADVCGRDETRRGIPLEFQAGFETIEQWKKFWENARLPNSGTGKTLGKMPPTLNV
jgi:hypothetical protein